MASRSHRGRRAAVGTSAPLGSRRAALLERRAARALVDHQHRTAAGLFALLVLAYLWPVLVGGNTLAPTALMFVYAPWRTGASEEIFRYFNGHLGDVPWGPYPWDVLARRFLHAGTFPAWNPYAFAGTPLFANAQIAWLSPFSLPLWILPLNYGFGLAAALKLWVAGFGTYLLARELRLSFWPALLAGTAFTLCAFNVVWLTYAIFVSVAALLPWALWLVERIVRNRSSADGLWLALVVALVLTGGHPGTQVHVLAATALYAVVRVIAAAGPRGRARVRSLVLVGAALVLGALLTAVVLLPAQRASIDSYGALMRQNGGVGLPGLHVPFSALRTALFPDWWGRPSERFDTGVSNYRERTYYAGAIPLILAALAILTPSGWRRKAPFALMAVLGTAIALRTPVLFPLVVHLPLFDQVQNQRMLLWFVFAVAMLAGFGLQSVIDAPRQRRLWAVLALALLAVPLAVAAVGPEAHTLSAAADYVVRRSTYALPQTLALASIGWWLVFVLALAAALAVARWRPHLRLLAAALVTLVVALDLLHFAHGYNPMGPPSVVVPPQTPVVSWLQRHVGDSRIVGVGHALQNDWSTIYGLRDVRGTDAPQPSVRFGRLWLDQLEDSDLTSVAALRPSSPKVLGMLGARYVVTEPEAPIALPGLKAAYQGADAAVYANARVVPRAFAVSSVRVAADGNGELAAVRDPRFDPRRDAVVRADELGDVQPPVNGGGTVRVTHERNSSVTLDAQLARRSLVVLDDQWMPGWRVEIDGHPAPILQTDIVLRGVVVPAGDHTITWTYRIPGFRAGAILTALGVVLLAGWALSLVLARRRRGFA